MTKFIPRSPRIVPLSRRCLWAAGAVSTIVLLTACSSQSTPVSSASAASSASSASASAAATSPSAPISAAAESSATPSAQSAVKKLVAGFPTTVLPLMPDATIQASSLEHNTDVSMASMTASVTASSADVLAYYTKSLTSQGFEAQPGDAVDGVPLKTFVRAQGQEIATVSIVQSASTATFTIGATLLPASFR